jgi:hypothetical protein
VAAASSDASVVVVELDGSSVKLTATEADVSKVSSAVCALDCAPRRGAT